MATNPTIAELELEKANLEKENEYLKMRKMDVEFYRKAFEKYAYCRNQHMTYDRLCNHPDYYTKWRGTFFDTQIKLIESGIIIESIENRTDRTLTEIREMDDKRIEQKLYYGIYKTPEFEKKITSRVLSKEEYSEAIKHCSGFLSSPADYEIFLDGICSFSELMLDINNPSKEPVYKDVDFTWKIIGLCDSVKFNDDKYQLHLTDPYGECLFPPFDITAEEVELALGRICVVECAYNHYAAEPKLLELQILPFTLTEKLGEYTKDTVIIRRSPKINFQRYAWL